jgi:glucosamine--fructose-6-phosphate aminotransferase (isomerizing)
MCGIFAYQGRGGEATTLVIEGLMALEHRGYDSVGLCRRVGESIELYRLSREENSDFRARDLATLIENGKAKSSQALGHNRWATFGRVSRENAHPHHDPAKRFFVVHNGNVENLPEIEARIGAWSRYSQTDTEAIAALIARFASEGNDLVAAVSKTISLIEGANAIVVLDREEPGRLVAANRGGNLILAEGEDGIMLASDPAAFEALAHSRSQILMDNEIAIFDSSDWQIQEIRRADEAMSVASLADKAYEYHMEAEIRSQPEIVANTMRGRLDYEQGIAHLDCANLYSRELRQAKNFHFVACGTAYHACLYASLLLGRFGIESRAHIASEFPFSHPVYGPDDAFIFVSQSGETADTIEILKEIRLKGNLNLGIVNVAGSRLWRDTMAGIGTRAGKERGVASTKAYTAQLVSVALLALFLARQRGMSKEEGQAVINELITLPAKIRQALAEAEKIRGLAKKYSAYNNFYYLGRGFNSISAYEGSLKLKEISYIHSEAYPLGEMKHGPLALVDPEFCSVVIAPADASFKKSAVNIEEIRSRGGRILALVNEGTSLEAAHDTIIIPRVSDWLSPLISVIPLQLFSFYMALELGRNPDKPRNLAKTVTVS